MINIAIDSKLEGGRARYREPSAIFITVVEGGALCMKDGGWHRPLPTRVRLIQRPKEVRCKIGCHRYLFLWWREAALHAVLMAPLLRELCAVRMDL